MQPAAVEKQRIGDRSGGDHVIEDPRATAQDRPVCLPWRIREGKSRSEIVVISAVVLPVVAQADCHGQVLPNLDLVLNEPAHLFLPENEVSIAGLLHKRKRLAMGVIVQRGKVEY